MRSTLALFLVSMSLNAALAADLTGLETPLPLKQGESVLTIIGTNDVHGGVDPAFRFGKRLGGYDWFAGCVNAVRAHSRKTYGETGQVIMLDAGDAAQGALTSNYSEGLLMASLMNQVGYNAAIPGNHAYDFGPVGWLDDTVPAGKQGDPLGALRRFVRALSFPMLSANVYTLDDQHLPELPPYTLISTFGRRNIAVIGLESPNTPETTMAENVKGLKFTPGVKELQEIVETLTKAGKADVFIAVMHHGDGSDKGMESFLKALPRRSTGEPLIDIMIAGHTHYVNDNVSGEIPYVQSGSNGRLFGLVQCVLVQDPKTRRLHVDRARTRKKGGIEIHTEPTTLLGEPVTADPKVTAILAKAHVEVQPIAGRVLAEFAAPLDRNNGRTADSLMGNFMADMMRDAAHTDIGIVNSGGVRDGLPKGTVTYNDLYGVMPFNNKMVTAHVPVELLVKNLELSIKTCGVRGALQISGIRLEFERNCERAVNAEDPQARLLKVVTNDGKVLYDATGASPVTAKETVTVATVDFMMTGGAGFTFFAGLPIDPNPPILRDAVADEMTKARAKPGRLDLSNFATGRYKNLLGDEQPAAPSSHHDEAGH